MASTNSTATINANRKRNKDGSFRKKNKDGSYRKTPKRSNPSSHGAAKRTAKRRNNPKTQVAKRRGTSIARTSNPGMWDFADIMSVAPATWGGVTIGRWAVKMAGPMENGEPGMKHALAGLLAIHIGAGVVAKVLPDRRAATFAYAAGLGYLTDLFMRKRFLKDQKWYTDNISLEGDAGVSAQEYLEQPASGLAGDYAPGTTLQLADGSVVQVLAGVGQEEYVNAQGQTMINTATGWQLKGSNNMGGFQSQSQLAGFQQQSALGNSYNPQNGAGRYWA